MDASQLNWLSAADAARAIRDGAISSEQLMESCLARVRKVENEVQAWRGIRVSRVRLGTPPFGPGT